MKVFGKRLHRVGILAAILITAALLTGCNDRVPPGNVQEFFAQASDGEVRLSWNNPQDKDLAGIKIMRTSGAASESPSDGLEIYNDLGSELTDASVKNGTRYFYTAWAYDKAGNLSLPAQTQATPVSSLVREEVLNRLSELAESIEENQDLLPEEQLELLEILDETEELFLEGDPCAAAELLGSRFSDRSQEIRHAGAKEAGEKVFAEGRTIRVNIARTMEDKEECESLSRIDVEAETIVERESAKNVSAWSVFGEPLMQPAAVEVIPGLEEVFTEIFIPGVPGLPSEVGAPAVPVFRQLIAVPRGDDTRVRIHQTIPVVGEKIYVNLYPVQSSPLDEVPPISVYKDPPFTKNHGIYESNDPWPPEPVTMQYIGNGRDLEIYLVEMAAGQYYPEENLLELFDYTDFDIEFEGGSGNFTTSAMMDLFDSNSLALFNSVMNKETVISNVVESTPKDREGEELLILTHPDFYDAAIRLRNWKREKGIVTNVYECGTGSKIPGRESNIEIDAFIEDRYYNTRIRVSYVLLLGDAEFIAPFYIDDIGTDWPYAILGTPGVDLIADFSVGRIPVDTLEEAMTVVNKIINYEKTPVDDKSFYQNAFIASQFECCRKDTYRSGIDSRTFIESSEFAHQLLGAAGKTVQRIYTRTGNDTPYAYYDGTPLPPALRSDSGFAWDGDTQQIADAWNKGAFLIIHRDHGWPGGWVHPEFRLWDIDKLKNEAKLPVVLSMNCSTGLFDNEIDIGVDYSKPIGIYFCERALRKENGGAVGLFGATRISPSWANSALTLGFLDAIWPGWLNFSTSKQSQRRLGDVLNHGKLYIIAMRGAPFMGEEIDRDYAQMQLYLWHYFGDPTMEIWTKNPHAQDSLKVCTTEHQERTYRDGIDFAGGILIEYGVENAVITVFSSGPDQQIPMGRGVVKDGVAEISYFAEHDMRNELIMIASFEDMPATPLTVTAQR
ncbi:MAG: hypothetical protein GX130_06820 [Candidatus Hydrogenedens sp.]|nr:hypothetical protein [Candidatus Hydrogenedens sp.]